MAKVDTVIEVLNSLVFSAAEDIASKVNDGGIKSQIAYLNKAGYLDENIIASILDDHRLDT